jgi:hypothetical protein
MKKELQEAIQEDNDLTANEILQDLYMRWFAFGLGVGIVVASVGFALLTLKQ